MYEKVTHINRIMRAVTNYTESKKMILDWF
jgi:hypothetical protein